jgi:hypothetical protein
MGFTITSPYTINSIGLTASNLYVSIKGAYRVSKVHAPASLNQNAQLPMHYMYCANYAISLSPTASPIYNGSVVLYNDTVPTNPFEFIYSYLEGLFPNTTIQKDE